MPADPRIEAVALAYARLSYPFAERLGPHLADAREEAVRFLAMLDAAMVPGGGLLAYAAGVIDSDGTIGIKRSTYGLRVRGDAKQPIYSERVAVKQVTAGAVDLLHELFGGTRRTEKRGCGVPMQVWQCTDRQAADCLVRVLPYLRIKRAQADNCLILRQAKEQSKRARVAVGRGHAGGASRPQNLSDAMEAAYQRAKTLNLVGAAAGISA